MRLKRLAKGDMKTNGKFDDTYWNSGIRLPNCTLYCLLRLWEEGMKETPLFTYTNGSKNFPNAKLWYTYWRGSKGTKPKVGSVIVWGNSNSQYGHVAICEDILEEYSDGSYKIQVSQSNYTRKNTQTMEANYFQYRVYTVKPGVVTSGVGMPYIGCCYVDLESGQAERNKTLHQLQVEGTNVFSRSEANGEKISGMYTPLGYYTVLASKQVGNDTWYKIGTNDGKEVWCGSYNDLPATEEAIDLTKYIVKRDKSKHQVEVLNQVILARKSPSRSGEKLGQLVPKGIYDVKDTAEADTYTWVKLDTDVWFALVGLNENVKDYPATVKDYKALYEAEVKKYNTLEDSYNKLNTEYNTLNANYITLETKVNTLESKIAKAIEDLG